MEPIQIVAGVVLVILLATTIPIWLRNRSAAKACWKQVAAERGGRFKNILIGFELEIPTNGSIVRLQTTGGEHNGVNTIVSADLPRQAPTELLAERKARLIWSRDNAVALGILLVRGGRWRGGSPDQGTLPAIELPLAEPVRIGPVRLGKRLVTRAEAARDYHGDPVSAHTKDIDERTPLAEGIPPLAPELSGRVGSGTLTLADGRAEFTWDSVQEDEDRLSSAGRLLNALSGTPGGAYR